MNPVMLAALLVALQTPAPAARCVVMPVRVPEGASTELKDAANGLELALADALRRHAGFHVLTRAEITAMVGKAAREQLVGCDSTSCVAEIADALGADLLATAQLDRLDGLWNLQASLVERKSAQAVQRAGVRARDVQALFASIEDVARRLATGSDVTLDDPRLQSRLATDAAGMDALRAAQRARPGEALTALWTDSVIAHNAESDRMALAEGGLFALSGVALVGLGISVGLGFFAQLVATSRPEGEAPMARRAYPVLLVPMLLVMSAPWLAMAAGAGVGALTAGVVDWMDRGRLRVGRHGCCRDEARIREAESPGFGRTVAPYLATAAAFAAMTLPVPVLVVPYALFGIPYYLWSRSPDLQARFRNEPSMYGPTVDVDGTTYAQLAAVGATLPLVLLLGPMVVFSVVTLGAAVVLMLTRYAPVTGDAAPADGG